MKHIISVIICIMAFFCMSCDKKESVSNVPDLSGNYSCSFSIPASPIYSVSQTVTLQKSGETSFSVNGSTPFERASLAYISGQQYQFRIPQTDIVKNGKTYYLTLTATLTYEGGVFKTYSCQAAYGEKGVSGSSYTINDFKLKKQ